MTDTAIEWTDRTWNPTVGCSRVSAGCEHCYAERMAHRLAAMGQKPYEGLTRKTAKGAIQWTGKVRFLKERLALPLEWRAPARIFVNSMSDLFHDKAHFDDVQAIYGVMAAAEQHTFQVLTKHHLRMGSFYAELAIASSDPAIACEDAALRHIDLPEFPPRPWPLPNVWIGVSAEDQPLADKRWDELAKVPAAVRFLSMEPMLGPITMRHWATLPDWVIVGGESGPGARECHQQWIRNIVSECIKLGVAVFVKQLGAVSMEAPVADRYGALQSLEIKGKGADMSRWPEDLRVRQFPRART